jgi:hypothetical protein
MVKTTFFLVMIASCAALGQRVDTANTVRQTLGSQGSATQAAPPAHVEVTSAPSPAITATTTNESSAEEDEQRSEHRGGKRDPFVSPISTATGPVLPASNCASGKRCLVIDQLVLRGVVRTANGMIAVVANGINKAYFLHENDPVFNGYVLRITGDTVVFKENVVDHAGHRGSREVVKKVTTPSV